MEDNDDYVPMRRWSEVQAIERARNARAARIRRRRRWVNTLVFLVTIGVVFGIAYANRDALLPAVSDTLSPTDPSAGPAPTRIPDNAVPATVDYVHDGDTLFIVQNGANLKVRLLAVDTPEIGDNAECYGAEATAFTRSLLPGGAEIFTVADTEPLDQYGRSLLFIYTADGTLVNYELVAQGFAEAVFIGDNRMLEAEFEAAEDAARAVGSGLWGACG